MKNLFIDSSKISVLKTQYNCMIYGVLGYVFSFMLSTANINIFWGGDCFE